MGISVHHWNVLVLGWKRGAWWQLRQGGKQPLLVRLRLEILQPGQPGFVPGLVALRVQNRLAVWLLVARSANEYAMHELRVGGSKPDCGVPSHREAKHRRPIHLERANYTRRIFGE